MKRMLISIGAVVLVLALLLTLAPACGNGDEEKTPTPGPGTTPTPGLTPTPTGEVKTLKIGFIGPLSGPAAPWGSGQQVGAKWAADDINAAGGIKVGDVTYMIEVPSCDTKFQGSVAATCANELVYDEGVHYLVGPIGNSEAIIPILHENKCFCTAGSSVWLGGPDLPYFIEGIVSYAAWTAAFYAQVQDHHPELKNLLILSADSLGGKGQQEASVAAAEALGYEVETGLYAQGTTDFYPLLTRLLAKNPDAIEASGSAGDGALIAKQARELGFTGWFLHVNWVPIGLMIDTMGLDEMYNIISTLPNFESDFYSPAMQELVRRYMEEKAKPDETDMPDTVVHGYSHMVFYTKAIEQAQSIDPDEVMKVFDDPSFRFERYYHSDGQLSGLETFGILRQMSHFNPYGELVVENGEAKVVQMGGRVAIVP